MITDSEYAEFVDIVSRHCTEQALTESDKAKYLELLHKEWSNGSECQEQTRTEDVL